MYIHSLINLGNGEGITKINNDAKLKNYFIPHTLYSGETNSATELSKKPNDRAAEKLFWFLFSATRGGTTRLEIMFQLIKKPYNASQLCKKLHKDYKVIQQHLRILNENNIVTTFGKKYSVTYFPSIYFEQKYDEFKDISKKIITK